MTDIHTDPVLGVIGGSGLYDIDGLENIQWREIQSAWGEPSDALLCGQLGDISLVFLPRHGRGHRLSPTTINYRANIDVFKRAGVTDIISLSAVGSFREELSPGTFVIVDQFIDRTFAREKSFFGRGLVAHVSMARPVNPRLADWCESACRSEGIPAHLGGTYLAMEGPQFSTFAESQMYRRWGCDVIGMTNMPEAKLAREAEIPYCTVAMVTDYDCWHPDHDSVDVKTIIGVLQDNADRARALIKQVAPRMCERPAICPSGDDRALESALITAPDARDPEIVKRLDAVAGRLLL
ncbi:MAG: S-methyl-5'-thioadenosine phosphorylase [Pseudomonadota bacterium]|nr:S-methyl-5'-thioadenosine phosphorylase [Pseudomonadota bacterium]